MQKLKLVNFEKDNETVISEFTCDFTVTTAGDGLWGCEAGRKVLCTGITTTYFHNDVYTMVNVEHDSTWDIYTDTAFETAISEAVGFNVRFTEQGMQDDCFASMEC